jgi:hypothetical protein
MEITKAEVLLDQLHISLSTGKKVFDQYKIGIFKFLLKEVSNSIQNFFNLITLHILSKQSI